MLQVGQQAPEFQGVNQQGDSVDSHRKFAAKFELAFHLIANTKNHADQLIKALGL